MRPHVLKGIYAERSKWETEILKHQQSTTADERTQRSGLSKGKKASGGNHMRVRASGGGAKQQFPHLVGEVKTWLERERSYGHGVQKMDLAWKYFQLLSVEKVKLEEKRDELEDGPQKILCINQLERAESQMKSIKEGYKQRDKRAKMLMDAIGAKHMTPNALAPLSNEEQQISAELAWNHHDYIMSLVSMGHEDLKEFVAKPECMLGFSDQVPVWVKKGSTKAVFAGHETRTHGKTIKKIRRDLQDELNQQAHETGTQ